MTTLLVFALLACGCDRPPQPDDIEKAITAWSGTLQLVGEEFNAGHVPPCYVRQVLKGADKQLRTQRQEIEQLPQSEPKRPPLEWRLNDVTAQAAALREQTRGDAP